MAEVITLEKISEFEMSPMEVDELRSVLEDILLSSGKFDTKQIEEWLDGFDACEVDEHRYSLIEYAHTFAESGVEQEARSTDILETNLLSTEEKAELALQIQSMDFVELGIFLEYIESLLQEAKKLEKDKASLQRNMDLSVEQRSRLIKEFETSKIADRKKMVSKLPMIVAEFKRKNEIDGTVAKIYGLISAGKISDARDMLSSGINVGNKYRELEDKISLIEISEVQEILMVA